MQKAFKDLTPGESIFLHGEPRQVLTAPVVSQLMPGCLEVEQKSRFGKTSFLRLPPQRLVIVRD